VASWKLLQKGSPVYFEDKVLYIKKVVQS
jgi:hypothetical protein